MRTRTAKTYKNNKEEKTKSQMSTKIIEEKETQNQVKFKKLKNQKKKNTKNLLVGGKCQFYQNHTFLFLLSFSSYLILGYQVLGVSEIKQSSPTIFLFPIPFQPNTPPTHLLSYFPLLFFHSLKNHPNQNNINDCRGQLNHSALS